MLVERTLRQRRPRLIPASSRLPNRYHSVRMTATHPVRRDRGTGSDSARLGGRIPGRSVAAAREISRWPARHPLDPRRPGQHRAAGLPPQL